MKTLLIPTTCFFLSIAGSAFAQDNAPTTPSDCSNASLTKCSNPNEPTDNGADINTNSGGNNGGTGTNNATPDEQPTGASPVNPATNPTAAPRGSSGNNSVSGSGN